MVCPHGASSATTERPHRTELGDRRFGCRDCPRELNERTGTPSNRRQSPTAVVCLVALWRFRYTLRLRALAEMALQRGLMVTHEAVREWEMKPAATRSTALRRRRHGAVGNSWYGDETSSKVQGQWQSLCRAIARAGPLVAVRLRATRGRAAAEAFLRSAWAVAGRTPARLTTEGQEADPRAIRNACGAQVAHRTNRSLTKHLARDHRGIKQGDRSAGGLKTFATAARFRRLCAESRALLRPRSQPHQPLTRAQRRPIRRERCTDLMGLIAAA